MLIVRDPADLLEYLKTRLEMDDRQSRYDSVKDDIVIRSRVFVWNEAIKAVEAMMNQTGTVTKE